MREENRRSPVYLDFQATTPVDERVLEAMLPFFGEAFGNPSSKHRSGQAAAAAVEGAREQVAELVGAYPQEIIFTSGATESNNLALCGAAWGVEGEGRWEIITSPTEHKAVLDPVEELQKQGFEVSFLPVDGCGVVDLEALSGLVGSETAVVSVMGANNEIGTLAPVEEIGAVTRERGVLFHCDGAQLVGKEPVDVEQAGIDLLSLSAHKMYGPKGVGALYVRRGVQGRLRPLLVGGGQERGLRSGTVNVPGVVGLGAAAELARQLMDEERAHLNVLRTSLWERLQADPGAVTLHGHPTRRLAGNLNVSFRGVDADNVIAALSDVAISSGSACTSSAPAPSHVLRAIGVGYEEAESAVRLGLGRQTTQEEVDYAAGRLAGVVTRLR